MMFNPEDLIFKEKLDAEQICELAMNDSQSIPILIEAMNHHKPKVKYTASKVLILYAAKEAEKLYPYFDQLMVFLDDFSSILQWNAMSILASLAPVDRDNKIQIPLIEKLFELLGNESMITSGNAVLCLGYIAQAKPDFTDLIVRKVLDASNIKRKTEECSRIIYGHIITSLSCAYPNSSLKKEIELFIESQINSERKGTATKARLFFSKLRKGLIK